MFPVVPTSIAVCSWFFVFVTDSRRKKDLNVSVLHASPDLMTQQFSGSGVFELIVTLQVCDTKQALKL